MDEKDGQKVVTLELEKRTGMTIRQVRTYVEWKARENGYMLDLPFRCLLEERGEEWRAHVYVQSITQATGS